MGMGIGAAMTGLRPIIEGMNMGFLLLAYNQISNNAGMLHYTSGGQYKVASMHARKHPTLHSCGLSTLVNSSVNRDLCVSEPSNWQWHSKVNRLSPKVSMSCGKHSRHSSPASFILPSFLLFPCRAVYGLACQVLKYSKPVAACSFTVNKQKPLHDDHSAPYDLESIL